MSLVYVISEKEPVIGDYGFLINIEAIKVGFTSEDVTRRISQLQTGNLRPLYPVFVYKFGSIEMAKQIEKLLHFNLTKWRISGEWFEYNQTVQNILNMISDLSYDFEEFSTPDNVSVLAVSNG